MSTAKPTPSADTSVTPNPKGNQWDDEDEWRHPPVAPVDAGVADSLGKSVSDVVTGPGEGAHQAGLPTKKPAKP